jgi:hypothetical protein
MDYKARIIAFYLPQFHPIPENDEWWGKGFTEWTNVGRATPLFKGHYQPRVPADLGYYDLRLAEIREEQAMMAKKAGVYGFCYWHYWFGNGKQLLERPFNEVLATGKPNFPFCLGWANESWEAKIWNAKQTKKNKLLMEQKYPGKEDNELHFYSLLNAFRDKRYITVDRRPLFLIYKPEQFRNINLFIKQWNNLAYLNGLPDGFYFVAHTSRFSEYNKLTALGFNSITVNPMSRLINNLNVLTPLMIRRFKKVYYWMMNVNKLTIIEYKHAVKLFINKYEDSIENVVPTIIPNWDHSPRSGRNGCILHNSTPQEFAKNVNDALDCIKEKPEEKRIIFLKSWNEWGESNYIEPDLIYGNGYLDVLKKAIIN